MSEQLPEINTDAKDLPLNSEDQFLAETELILPYITAALESGMSVCEILRTSIGRNADGSPKVPLDTSSRMGARVPATLGADEDSTLVVVAHFTDATISVAADDGDYSTFDKLRCVCG